MKALAAYIVSGRWQAALVTAASGLLALLLLPLSCLGAAAIALVTLHVGVLSGLQVLVLATASVILMYLLAGVQALVVIVMALLLWLPCWLAAAVLQQTRDLGAALKAATLFGVTLLLLVYATVNTPQMEDLPGVGTWKPISRYESQRTYLHASGHHPDVVDW